MRNIPIIIVKHFGLIMAISIPFGLIYFLILYFFQESLDAEYKLDDIIGNFEGGASTLLFLTSAILGWVSIVALEHNLGLRGMIIFLMGITSWIVAIGSGIISASLFIDHYPTNIFVLVACCVVIVIGVGGFKTYLSS